ncbi:MAG: alpha/beta fold hydrolase [Acidobacteria bacterium]|nr:alpha/beta fold hydrolase [Acidobacteriota bacterium]
MPAELSYVESGVEHAPGGTLVLLHGFPLNADMWEPLQKTPGALPGGWRLIAPHFRGFGGSAGVPDTTPEDQRSMDDYAADVEALLDALHVHRAVIGGLSMGGYAAFALFRRAAARFRGMILADTRPQPDSEDARAGRLRMIELAHREGPRAIADQMLPKLISPQNHRLDLENRLRSMAAANTPDGLAGALQRMMRRPDSTPLLGTIACPTLVVVGSEDVLTPPQVAREMQRQIPRARLEIIEAAGHVPNLEQPEAFNVALSRFLASITR